MITLRLFDHLSAASGDEPLRLTEGAEAARLLAFLLLNRGAPISRQRAAFELWPDVTENEAVAQLRRQLFALKSALPPTDDANQWLLTDRGSVSWNPASAYRLDIEEFETTCREEMSSAAGARSSGDRERLLRELDSYRGDLLVNWPDDWIKLERERLRLLRGDALQALLGMCVLDGDARAAADTAERIVGYDELREEAHRLLIGLSYVAGDRASALLAYRRCRELMADTFDVEPMPSTLELVKAISVGEPEHRILRLLQRDVPPSVNLRYLSPPTDTDTIPAPLTSLVGREDQAREVIGLLGSVRLLTMTGAGGSGKTRLAREVAVRLGAWETDLVGSAELAQESMPPLFADGVRWVDLTPVDDPAGAVQALAAAFRLSESPGKDLVQQLEAAVALREMLLVFDNAEHLVGGLAPLVERLLQAAGDLKVLVTSRVVLGVAGEAQYEVPPLSVPPTDGQISAENLMAFEAPRLFLERASESQAEILATDSDRAMVSTVCRRLDGLPLAIELAAARTRVLSVSDLAERLDERFALLTAGPRTAPARQRTLLATMDWSYDLLDEADRTLLRRLSVFRGGWTVEAASQVCKGKWLPEAAIPAALASLADKSMVDVGESAEHTRFRLLQTTRDYATSKLVEFGEQDSVRTAHLGFFHALALQAKEELMGPKQGDWLDALETERANLNAALAWSLTDEERAVQGLEMATALRWFWFLRGYLLDGREWLESALGVATAATVSQRAEALNAVGVIVKRQGDLPAAATYSNESLAAWYEEGNRHWVGLVTGNLGSLALEQGDLSEARRCYEESATILEQEGDDDGVANARFNLAHVEIRQCELDSAQQHVEFALKIKEQQENHWAVATAKALLGRIARQRGDPDLAQAYLTEASTALRDLGDEGGAADVMLDAVGAAHVRGDDDEALKLAGECLAVYRKLGYDGGVAKTNNIVANIQIQSGVATDTGEPYDLLVSSLLWFIDDGNNYAIAATLGSLGELAATLEDPGRAATLWGATEVLRQHLGGVRDNFEEQEFAGYVERTRAHLGAQAYDEAFARGEAMTTEEAIVYALEI